MTERSVRWWRILPNCRTYNVWIVFKKLVKNIYCTASGTDSAHSEVESIQIRVRGVVARLAKKNAALFPSRLLGEGSRLWVGIV